MIKMVFAFLFLFSVHSYANQCQGLFVQTKLAVDSELVYELDANSSKQIKKNAIYAYTEFSRKYKRTPNKAELAEGMGLREESLNSLLGDELFFRDMSEIKSLAFKRNPKVFESVRDKDYFNLERAQKTVSAIKKSSRLLVVSAEQHKPVDQNAFAALLKMARELDASIIVIPVDGKTTFLDPVLFNNPQIHILTHDIRLSEQVVLRSTSIKNNNQNPINSLKRIGNRGEISIFGASKLHSEIVPTKNNEVGHHILYTSGSITRAESNMARPTRTASEQLAEQDHQIGVVLLEKTMGRMDLLDLPINGSWNVRAVRYIEEVKGYSDLRVIYTKEGQRKTKYLAASPGDLHFGKTDPRWFDFLLEFLRYFGVEYMVGHDTFDGYSGTVSHWNSAKFIDMTRKAKNGEFSVYEELMWNVHMFNRLHKEVPKLKILIAEANHNGWLYRWIDEKRFIEDPHNRELGMELAQAVLRGEDPYQYFIMKHVDNPKRMIFLKADQSYNVGPKERMTDISNHGHQGANGARGSQRGYLLGYSSTMYGHSHTVSEKNGIFNIGTSTYLSLDYTRGGMSSWANAVGVIDEFGQRQVLIFRNGELFATPESIEKAKQEFFFEENMPLIELNPDEKSPGQKFRTTFEEDE